MTDYLFFNILSIAPGEQVPATRYICARSEADARLALEKLGFKIIMIEADGFATDAELKAQFEWATDPFTENVLAPQGANP
jgi:hypothetical protein